MKIKPCVLPSPNRNFVFALCALFAISPFVASASAHVCVVSATRPRQLPAHGRWAADCLRDLAQKETWTARHTQILLQAEAAVANGRLSEAQAAYSKLEQMAESEWLSPHQREALGAALLRHIELSGESLAPVNRDQILNRAARLLVDTPLTARLWRTRIQPPLLQELLTIQAALRKGAKPIANWLARPVHTTDVIIVSRGRNVPSDAVRPKGEPIRLVFGHRSGSSLRLGETPSDLSAPSDGGDICATIAGFRALAPSFQWQQENDQTPGLSRCEEGPAAPRPKTQTEFVVAQELDIKPSQLGWPVTIGLAVGAALAYGAWSTANASRDRAGDRPIEPIFE